MTDYDRTNTGVLFKNDDKQSDRSADYSGSLNVDGAEFFLDAWIKESKQTGRKFLSVRVKQKQQKQDRRAAPSRSRNDDPPF